MKFIIKFNNRCFLFRTIFKVHCLREFQKFYADQMVQWLGKSAAVPEVPGSNPG